MTREIHPAALLREVVKTLESTRADLDEDIATLKIAATAAMLDQRVIRADSLDRLLAAVTAFCTQYVPVVMAGNELVEHINETPIWSELSRPEGDAK